MSFPNNAHMEAKECQICEEQTQAKMQVGLK